MEQYIVQTVVCVLIVLGMGYYMYRDTPKPIMLGINKDLSPIARHGFIHIDTGDGLKPIPFRVDKPHMLFSPSEATVRQLFEQVAKFHLQAYTIDIQVGGINRIYRYDNMKDPILLQAI